MARWVISICLFICTGAAAGSDAKPYWYRTVASESCSEYQQRLKANNYEMWRAHWCARQPCVALSPISGPRPNVPNNVHPYWIDNQHGCRCRWGSWDYTIGRGEVKDCEETPPQEGLIFEDGFESGDTSRWTATEG